jgi:FKBP-type peptidyl-prolyl cis-trans isomerase FklB
MYKVLLISLVFVIACKNQEKSIKINEHTSITFLEKSKSGKKPQIGQVCLVDYITEFNDSTYEYSEDINPEGLTYVFDAEQIKSDSRNQFCLAFTQMEEGDSAAVRLQLPEDFVKKSEEKGMPTRDHVITYMRLKKLMTQLEADAFNAAISARAMLDYHQAIRTDSMVGILVNGYLPNFAKKDFTGFTKMPSGVQYKILSKGNGNKPQSGNNMRFDLCVYTTLGKRLASSYARASPESFRLKKHNMLPALYEVFPNIEQGGSAIIFAPSNMAYGDKGNAELPPNSDIVLYVELLKVRK